MRDSHPTGPNPLQAADANFPTEQSFRLLVESVEDYAIFMLDPEGRVMTWNLGAQRIKLYRASEVIGKHFSIFYPEESLESGLPQFELTMAARTGRHEDEGWRLRKNGSRFWANVIITALRDQQGKLVGFGKVTRDLSERRRAEQGINAAYDQINSVLECISDSVIQVNKDWTLIYGNRNAAALPEFILGRNYWDCFADVCGTSLEAALRKSMADRTEASYEACYGHPPRWYRGRLFPTRDGLSIFFTDFTEEKALQDEVERALFLKEKRIEALGHMAAGLAHEINNPLAIIQATANNLWQATDTQQSTSWEEVRTACETIVRTSDRAIRVLRGLKGFGRDAAKDPMETASIYEILEQCIELQGARFERYAIPLTVTLEPELPYIDCRGIQIGQIITNLLNNAFDAVVHEESARRWVTLEANRSGDWLHIDVTDSGPGIPEEIKVHLREPFFTTQEAGLGMGIGLSLSRAISMEHGGSLTLSSEKPQTTFRLALPIPATTPRH